MLRRLALRGGRGVKGACFVHAPSQHLTKFDVVLPPMKVNEFSVLINGWHSLEHLLDHVSEP